MVSNWDLTSSGHMSGCEGRRFESPPGQSKICNAEAENMMAKSVLFRVVLVVPPILFKLTSVQSLPLYNANSNNLELQKTVAL